MSYSTLEASLVTQLRTLSIYDSGNCRAINLDEAVRYANEQDSGSSREHLMFVDYGGGHYSASAGRMTWTHVVFGLMAVRVEEYDGSDEVDIKLREAEKAVRGLLWPNNRNVANRCQLMSIGKPFPLKNSNTVWLGCILRIEIDEDSGRC